MAVRDCREDTTITGVNVMVSRKLRRRVMIIFRSRPSSVGDLLTAIVVVSVVSHHIDVIYGRYYLF